MSAADHVAIRTRDGVRVVPRRAALGMIARGSAKVEPRQPKPKPVPLKELPVKSPKTKPVRALKDLPVAKFPKVSPKRGPVLASRPVEPDPVVEPVADVVKPAADVVDTVADDVTALPVAVPVVELVEPKQNASRKTWAEYASTARGVVVTSDMTRNQIRDLIGTMNTDRMSQPAFTEHSVTGGRLATPEDVPVTESAVTNAHPDSAGA